jgi:hypothetical protein
MTHSSTLIVCEPINKSACIIEVMIIAKRFETNRIVNGLRMSVAGWVRVNRRRSPTHPQAVLMSHISL